jgi:hypothetical protein
VARRVYTRRQKATAVIAAEMSTVAAAALHAGIPETTVRYWMDEPEFVLLRAKTREEVAVETRTLAVKALGEIRRRLGEFEPRDLTILYGVLTDKAELVSGHATSRSETRDITDALDDHESEVLAGIIRDAIAEAVT